jgi:hypothetical protein
MLITLGHDGDNAFGGGYSYYMESVPAIHQSSCHARLRTNHRSRVSQPITLPPQNDIVHVEDGAWINADGDFGDPDFPNWMWPPHLMPQDKLT